MKMLGGMGSHEGEAPDQCLCQSWGGRRRRSGTGAAGAIFGWRGEVGEEEVAG